MRCFVATCWLALVGLWGCGQEQANSQTGTEESAAEAAAASAPVQADEIARDPLKNVYFGDTHIHTILSFDAYLMGTRRTPDDAYDFAKGAAIEHASGFMMQMNKPLDFLAVSDHAFYLGMMRELASAAMSGQPDGGQTVDSGGLLHGAPPSLCSLCAQFFTDNK